MPRDDSLRKRLGDLADSSNGRLTFKATTSTLLAADLRLQLSRSPNPIYVFEFDDANGDRRTCVAFTLALDGERRPATRAEALGRSLAESHGRLFELNPFLLVFDYTGERLLAVSAVELFHAFAMHASGNDLAYSGSSSFSLSPNFRHGTIHMYAQLRKPLVWAISISSAELSVDAIIEFLSRVVSETHGKRSKVPMIVRAIESRLDAAPLDSSSTVGAGSQPSADAVAQNWVQLEPRDEAIRVDSRLWQIILTAISSSPGVILVGPPGTGKSALLRKAIGTLSENRQNSGFPGLRPPLWATPDESWTARELIGGETVAGGEIVFRPGWVLRAIEEDRWLVLDEANRGDLDRIFGALLTWLAGGEVTVGVESSAEDAKVIELGWTSGPSVVETTEADGDMARGRIRYLASQETWKLLGTYNALDAQRVFRIGAALGRRFTRVPVPPVTPHEFDHILTDDPGKLAPEALIKIGLLYRAHYEAEITRVGPAQFLDMRKYILTATELRVASEPDGLGNLLQEATEDQQSLLEHALEEAAMVGHRTADTATSPASEDSGTNIVDSVVSEAYVLSLGTLLAQLEDPDLDQLMQRVKTSGALTQEGIVWVTEMTRSLA